MADDFSEDVSQYTDSDGNPDTGKIEAEAERRGLDAAQKQSFIADALRRIAITVAKAKQVYQDAETGAEYGSVVPVYGTAIGTAAGAVYGVVDQFGGDIKSLLSGGPRWNEDEYNALRKKCRDAGGQSVPGKAPNNLDACIFPDGTLSGGDNPVWASQAEYESDQATRAANLTSLSSYIDGIKRIDGMIATADAAVRKAAKAPTGNAAAVRATWMTAIGKAFVTVYNAANLPGAPPVDVAGYLRDMSPRVYTPPPQTHQQKLASLAGLGKLRITTPATVVKLATLSKLPVVHMTVLAAQKGDPAAKAVVAATVAAAERTGAPVATVQAATAMNVALKLQKRSAYVTYWLYGDGAKKLAAG